MKHLIVPVGLLIAIALIFGGIVTWATLSPVSDLTGYNAVERGYFEALNALRKEHGLRELRRNSILDAAAKAEAEYVASLDEGTPLDDLQGTDQLRFTSDDAENKARVIAAGYPEEKFLGASIGRKYPDGEGFLQDHTSGFIGDPNPGSRDAREIGIHAIWQSDGYVIVAEYGK